MGEEQTARLGKGSLGGLGGGVQLCCSLQSKSPRLF